LNQGEILGLAHAFVTEQCSKHFADNLLKKVYGYLNGDEQISLLQGKQCILITDLAISLVFMITLLGNTKFDFVHQTVSRWDIFAG